VVSFTPRAFLTSEWSSWRGAFLSTGKTLLLLLPLPTQYVKYIMICMDIPTWGTECEREEVGEICRMRTFVICILHQILLRSRNKGRWNKDRNLKTVTLHFTQFFRIRDSSVV
jgi:hypothetical protein